MPREAETTTERARRLSARSSTALQTQIQQQTTRDDARTTLRSRLRIKTQEARTHTLLQQGTWSLYNANLEAGSGVRPGRRRARWGRRVSSLARSLHSDDVARMPHKRRKSAASGAKDLAAELGVTQRLQFGFFFFASRYALRTSRCSSHLP